MKFKLRLPPEKFSLPLAPMLDIALLMMMFFVLNLKLVTPQGNLELNLPISAPNLVQRADVNLTDIKVGLRSDRNGVLTQLTLGSKNLGNDDAAFDRLNREILQIIGRPGNPLTKGVEIEIDADFETQYRYVAKAISQCAGRIDVQTKQIARYVEKIRFAPPHKPKA